MGHFMKKSTAAAVLISVSISQQAGAITLTDPNPTYIVNDPGSFSPVCEVSTISPMIRGTDNDFFFLNDSYFMGVTDASGTIGRNNIGLPNPAQQRAVQVGSTAAGLGFVDRNDLLTPKFLTIWEGIADPNVPGSFIPGAILFQDQIPQNLILANCQGSNQAPVANSGADQIGIIPGSLVTLDGSASADPDNDALTFNWVQTAGSAVVLSNPNSVNPTFAAPGSAATTPLVFQLVVNDGTVNSAADTISISILDNVAAAQAAIADFVPERANLLLAHQPDLQRRLDRLQGRAGPGHVTIAGVPLANSQNLPVSVRNAGGHTSVSASLRQTDPAGRFDVWVEGSRSDFRFGARRGKAAIAYGGVDFAANDSLLVGVMGQYDRLDYDASITTGVTDGEGWMAGPYVTARVAGDMFLDVRAAIGASTNRIAPFGTYTDQFKTNRGLIAATLTGELALADGLVLRPDASVQYLKERQKSYVDSLNSFIPSQNFAFGQISAAPRIMYEANLSGNMRIRPFVEARAIHNFGDNVKSVPGGGTRLQAETGTDFYTVSGFRASASGYYDGIGSSQYQTTGFRLSASIAF